jgi:amidase
LTVTTATALAALAATAQAAGYQPAGHSIAGLHQALRSGQTTSAELVDYYLARIDRYDDRGPALHAIDALNAHARAQARAADAARRAGRERGPLAGIPFVVKDNIDVVGMPTTGGSVTLANNYPSRNATVVQRLLDAGAIVLGKTNMSEFAASYGRLGYSSYGGVTKNPYDLLRDASGSSSGSAAAVAAGFATFALGSDTSGSVRGPSAVTGRVGVRPSRGLVSRAGVLPLASSFDTVGPIANSVGDARLVLRAIAGPDVADPTTAAGSGAPFTAAVKPRTFQHTRIGVIDAYFGGNREVDHGVRAAIARMQRAGAVASSVGLGPPYAALFADVLGPVGDAEFATQLEQYLAGAPDGVPKTLAQIIALSSAPGVKASATPVNPARLKGLETAQASRSLLGGPDYQRITTALMPALRDAVMATLRDRRLDALVFPTMACVASVRYGARDKTYRCRADDPYTASYVSSATGLPEVTVPVGRDAQGLPIGLSFLGTAGAEDRLLSLAQAWEKLAPTLPGPGGVPAPDPG